MNPKTIPLIALMVSALFMATCGGGKQSARSVADKWCELNSRLKKAEGQERQLLRSELNTYENEIEKKYRDNEAFMNEVETLTKACD